MIKYANNGFLAAKISLINDIGNICKELSIDGDFLLMLGNNVFYGNLTDETNRQQEDRADTALLAEEMPTSS